MIQDVTCLRCEEVETIEHLLYGCDNYSAKKWRLAGRSLTLAIARNTGDYIPNIDLIPLEIIYNKPHPSILVLHIKDATTLKNINTVSTRSETWYHLLSCST
jgi:hypothetical protein